MENSERKPRELTREELKRMGRAIPGGFFVYRVDGTLLYANDNTLHIYGCESWEELLALSGGVFRGMVHPDDYELVEESISAQIADRKNGDLDNVEYRILRRDGEVRWVDDYGYLASLEGYGEVYYVFLGDITERRRVQEEKLRVELALEREKRANEVKNEFLFNISHDIRTPMNAVLGFTVLARRHRDDPARLETYLEKVDASGRQLLSLIDDLLEMQRLDGGRVRLSLESVDLRAQMDMVLDLFRAQAEKKGLTLSLRAELPGTPVLLDAGRFRRVLGNLLSNAVKFTPEGGSVTLTARCGEASDSGYARYRFTVEDTGAGMSREFMGRMFRAFEREESSTRSREAGAGLGLSIVKSLLDLMGGTVTAESRRGEGSRFTVELPLKRGDRQPPQETEAEDTGGDRAQGEYRILLVEDIELNRMLAETLLEEAGFLVESVPDGSDAVEAVAGHPLWYYDLVLMDIQMPVMNGYEATRAIRALNRADASRLPIIALSANAREEDRRQSLESGMDNHVAKPFDMAKLLSAINEQLSRRRNENG